MSDGVFHGHSTSGSGHSHRAGDGTGVGRHDVFGVAASLVIAEILLSGSDCDFGRTYECITFSIAQ
jgi:hypothetical protein